MSGVSAQEVEDCVPELGHAQNHTLSAFQRELDHLASIAGWVDYSCGPQRDASRPE
ncbi:hypothetical protein PHLCEN_2v1872 [Hermanssonia centrifuga]|uniref:Uncharacterized protein n=1 Tax=Hermanssonia centrifuga TaxID=98765 RepID=A0A2R6RVN5_9APHY|nr:hypothetical protein PHLCEN_2v1872 [Hermanssonia centrifuga]